MSMHLIRAVYVKPDGVFLYSKSENDDRPFHQWKCDSLTEVYQSEGQQGLDREIVKMLCKYAQIQGHHVSVKRYRPCIQGRTERHLKFIGALDNEYAKLSQEDIATLWLPDERQTDGAKAYSEFKCKAEHEYYGELAQLAEKPADKASRRNAGLLR